MCLKFEFYKKNRTIFFSFFGWLKNSYVYLLSIYININIYHTIILLYIIVNFMFIKIKRIKSKHICGEKKLYYYNI